MPVACICAYITVEPTNLNPFFFIFLDNLSEISLVAGTSLIVFHLLIIGFPPTNFYIYSEKDPNSF